MAADRLTAFLYLLMRDHVPTGTVSSMLSRIEDDEFVMSAPELEALAMRYSAPLRAPATDDEDEEAEAEAERERDETRVQFLGADEEDPLHNAAGGVPFTSAMATWLDEFDDRITSSPHFVQAVNEAAENEMVADEVAARLVAQRVGELTEQAARQEAKDEPPAAEETTNEETN